MRRFTRIWNFSTALAALTPRSAAFPGLPRRHRTQASSYIPSFTPDALGLDAANAKALIFNVKGEDLLWLDKANAKLTPEMRADYEKLGLPAGPFQSVAFYAPTRKGSDTPMPDTGSRQEGISPYVWTLREFCRERLLRFAFVDGEDARAQIHLVISRVEHALEWAAREGDQTEAGVSVDGTALTSFGDLVELLDGTNLDAMMRGAPIASGTLDAFRRRLHAAAERMGHLVSGHSQARNRTIDWSAQQVTVVDIHSLHATAQLFVVGVLLKRMMDQKEQQGGSRPLVFVVLDELNKYAPREGLEPAPRPASRYRRTRSFAGCLTVRRAANRK